MRKMADEILAGKTPISVIKEFLNGHKRIIFGGDGYSLAWEEEAFKRGLPNRKNTVEAIECLKNKDLTDMLVELGVYSQVELDSRYEILLEGYSKVIQVEALTALKMARNEIYPACCSYLNSIANTSLSLKNNGIDNEFILEDVLEFSSLLASMKKKIMTLENMIFKAQKSYNDCLLTARVWRDKVVKAMDDLRKIVDMAETKVDKKCWPIPTYMDLLFGI